MIIDTDQPLTAERLAELKAAGVVAIGRYLNRHSPNEPKVIKPAEAHLFAAAGMHLFLIYEFDGHPKSAVVGTLDGKWCAQYAPTIGAPTDGSAFIAYTVDYDAPESDMAMIRPAFAAFAKAIAPAFQTWAYASGAVCSELYAAKLIAGRWLTCSSGFRGTRQALADGAYEMRQALPHETAGVNADPDSSHVANFIPGFIPFAPASASPPIASSAASASLLAEFDAWIASKNASG